jgi:NADPH-dependent ferric siderophore reductase
VTTAHPAMLAVLEEVPVELSAEVELRRELGA